MPRRLPLLLILLITVTLLHAQSTPAADAVHSPMASGRWVRISVSESGVHQITTASLRAMGFSNPDRVHLYGNNREMLPENGLDAIPSNLNEIPLYRTSDKVLFYARGTTRWQLSSATTNSALFTHTNNPYATRISYFLSDAEESTPLSLDTYAYNVNASAPELTTFPEHSLVESDAFSFLHSGRTFYEAYDYATGATRSYTLPLPGRAASSRVVLNVQFAAAGSSASTLSVQAADSTLGTLSFPALSSYEYGRQSSRSFTLPASSATSLSIRLQHNRVSGISGHLDYLRASYLRNLQMSGSQLAFRPSRSGDVRFTLAGATSSTIVWRVTSDAGIEQVAATFDAASSTLSIPFSSATTSSSAWRSEELVALNPEANFPSPTIHGAIANQDLHNLTGVQLVIIVPTSGRLTSQARRLAALHEQLDGMTCAVVTAQEVYNEFSHGTPDLTAMRLFVRHLYNAESNDTLRLRNLLMFGGGVWDNRMVTSALSGLSPDDYLPCYESEASLSTTSSYVLEEYPALIDESRTTSLLNIQPSIGVGRIPVNTLAEATTVVDKLEAYLLNTETGSWKNTLVFLCDDGNDNVHMKDGDAVIAQTSAHYPDYLYRRIYWDAYNREQTATGNGYPDVQDAIAKQITDGALIMNYTGHGAAYMLSHEKVIRINDFAEWSSPRLPLWITAACDVSPFDMYEDNIGTTGLLNPDGAAIGFVSTARTVYSTPNQALNRAFMTHVLADSLNRPVTIGEALAMAKSDLALTSSSPINRAAFVLLGDPALSLRRPTLHAVIDRIEGNTATTSAATLPIGEQSTITGHIETSDGRPVSNFNGTIHPIVFDNLETITCHNNPIGEVPNGNDADTPAHVYKQHVQQLAIVADSVRNGQFSVTFTIPVDNNYSGQAGLISLYATNIEHSAEAQGSFSNFTLASSISPSAPTDTIAPNIAFYLNAPEFTEGATVNSTPYLVLNLHDESGINLTGAGIGHDISLAIDNDATTTYSLNSYFQPTVADHRSGQIQFSIPQLADGEHSLIIRAFDIWNNAATKQATFLVNQSVAPSISLFSISAISNQHVALTIHHNRPGTTLTTTLRIYDTSGRQLWTTEETHHATGNETTFTWNPDATDAHLTPGLYIARVSIASNGSATTSESQKFIITGSAMQ